MCSYRIRVSPNPGSRVLIKEKKLWAQIHKGGQCGDTQGRTPCDQAGRCQSEVSTRQGKGRNCHSYSENSDKKELFCLKNVKILVLKYLRGLNNLPFSCW